MGEVKVCDRCGKIIKLFDDALEYKEEAWRYEITKDCHPYPDKINIDLCFDCKKDLVHWLKDKERKKNE